MPQMQMPMAGGMQGMPQIPRMQMPMMGGMQMPGIIGNANADDGRYANAYDGRRRMQMPMMGCMNQGVNNNISLPVYQ